MSPSARGALSLLMILISLLLAVCVPSVAPDASEARGFFRASQTASAKSGDDYHTCFAVETDGPSTIVQQVELSLDEKERYMVVVSALQPRIIVLADVPVSVKYLKPYPSSGREPYGSRYTQYVTGPWGAWWVVTLKSRASLSLSVLKTTVAEGETVTVSGTLSPTPTTTSLALTYRMPNGTVLTRSVSATSSTGGPSQTPSSRR
ncbi:MAG: hypothetical protein QW057_05885 [Candidatus Bathyarchaeia archaeon]